MLPLAGYAERLSARPGESLRFHVANATGARVTASVVRVRCADPNPAIGGVSTEPVAIEVTTLVEPGPQVVPSGSYAVVGQEGMFNQISDCTLSVRIRPTLALPRRQVILSCLDDRGRGISLELTPALTLRGAVGTAAGLCTIDTAQAVSLHAWTAVTLTVDSAKARLSLSMTPITDRAESQTVTLSLPAAPVLDAGSRRLSFASASDIAPVDTFNGRLEHPVLMSQALAYADDGTDLARAAIDACIGNWDFAREMHTRRIVDTGPAGNHGELVNTPTRAVVGSNWTGEEHCFRHAPEQYGAIHFHDDDLDDCCWPATHAITLPDGIKSDAYALILRAGDIEENIPFFVVPPKGRANAKIAVLVSTYTYTVYGNHARPEWMIDPKWRATYIEQAKAWKAYPYNPGEHRDYGLSTYNYHTDGSGIGLVSWRRPMLNLRVGYLTYPYPDIRGSGLRHYPADSHLLMWLAHQGYEVDLITDVELNSEAKRCSSPTRWWSPVRTPNTTRPGCSMPCRPIATAAAGWSILGATVFTGRSRSIRPARTSSRSGAAKVASGPGPQSPASTTTSSMRNTAVCGDAMPGRRKSWSGSALPRRAISWARTTASSRRPAATRRSVGSLMASPPRRSAARASRGMARPALSSTVSTSVWVHPRTRS
jgi:N,N-dimethylformamidase